MRVVHVLNLHSASSTHSNRADGTSCTQSDLGGQLACGDMRGLLREDGLTCCQQRGKRDDRVSANRGQHGHATPRRVTTIDQSEATIEGGLCT